MRKGTTFYFLNEPEIELAGKLVEAIPCADAVHYTGSGTEATFYCLRMARAFTGRNKIMKFEGAWHGMHDYGLWGTVPSTPSPYPRALPDSIGVPAETGDIVLVAPFNDIDRAVALIEAHAHELAAVIVEPLQRVLLPEPGFLQAIRDATARHGIVLVFDEIVTGFRIAWGGAQEKYGVVPDLACYGKAVSGGFPLAAIAGRADVMGVLDAPLAPARAGRVGDAYAERQPGVRDRGVRGARRAAQARRIRPVASYRPSSSGRHRRGRHAARLCRAGAGGGRGVRDSLHRPSAANVDGPHDRRQEPRLPLGNRAPCSAACS